MNGADTPEYWVFDFAVPVGAAFELEGGLVDARARSATGRRRRGWRVGFRRLDYFTRKLDFMESAIRKQLTPQANVIARLCTIPGVEVTTAWTIIAEMGLDMGVFPDGDHAANWSGVCPGNRETANKRLSGRTRKGNRYLRRALVQTAWAISHRKDRNFLTALFYPHARSQGRKKAALTVAHRVQTIAFHILRDGEVYREMGGDFYDRQHPERTAKRLLERLKQLGLEVEVRPRAGETDAAVMKAVAVEAPAPEREPSSPPENAAAQVEPAAKPVGSKTAGRPRKRPATEVDGQASGGGGCTRCDRGVSSASTLVRNEGNQKLRVSLLPRSQRGNPKCFSKE